MKKLLLALLLLSLPLITPSTANAYYGYGYQQTVDYYRVGYREGYQDGSMGMSQRFVDGPADYCIGYHDGYMQGINERDAYYQAIGDLTGYYY